jgi:phosphoglycolate phosphatase-like HAD superfamily hydrolase
MKLWIFDLDGTLTDSFPVFFRSMRSIFSRRGKEISDAQLHSALGTTMPEFFALHLGAEHAAAAVRELAELSVISVNEVKPFEGIPECLELLRSRQREIGIWTARDRDSAERILASSGIGRFASHLVSGNCVTRAKPDPEGAQLTLARFSRTASESVMVGDHAHDVNAALSAGVFGVRASWNPYWPREACTIAQAQFFSVPDFARWIEGSVR